MVWVVTRGIGYKEGRGNVMHMGGDGEDFEHVLGEPLAIVEWCA